MTYICKAGEYEKLFNKILTANSNSNIPFEQICKLIAKLGFTERIKGSHHIFYNKNVEEIINLQPKNNKAKPYRLNKSEI